MLAHKATGTVEQPSLNLLGTFALVDADGRPVAIRSKKNKALLACLALSPDCAVTRDRLGTLLWGSHGEEQARASVRQSLVILRKELGPLADAILVNEGEILRLRRSALSVDALDLLAHESHKDIANLRRIAQRVSPEPLSDYKVQEEGFDEWLRHERARLNAASTRLLERLCEMESGSMKVDAARRLLELDPLRESSHRTLMRAYLAQGDKSLALKQFDECRALLRRELQVDPSEETVLLRQEIASGKASGTPSAAPPVEPDRKSDPKLPGRPSIAVLPFANIYSEESQQYFSDGITEELITSLSRFRHLFVIARPSSFHYRDETMTAGEIGRKLGVKFLLYGTIGRLAGRIRVTAQLVEAETETTVWSEKFDRAAGDIFEVIDELSSVIVASTVGRIDQQLLRHVRRKQTENLAAYELFLRGRALMHSPRREDKLAARRLFEEAISVLEGAPEDTFYYYAWLVICYVQTGRLEEARKLTGRIAELSPDFTLSRVRERELLRDPNDLTLWLDALREAGVPE
jgi:TolB-like protein